jgi:DNA-binding transcriptional MerR regulator
MIIALLSSIFVLAIKTLKREELVSIFKKDFIPISEIREFCSLYEERNALVLEIRKAESETKRKKLAKKTYKNLLSKNTAKIDQIKDEILPFKKILMETNNTFSNIVKRLDVIDAERTSISDSLNLLEARYKRGKLPSKAAYQKLSGDFFNRQKKLDRTIDKYIQQLRSYIL